MSKSGCYDCKFCKVVKVNIYGNTFKPVLQCAKLHEISADNMKETCEDYGFKDRKESLRNYFSPSIYEGMEEEK